MIFFPQRLQTRLLHYALPSMATAGFMTLYEIVNNVVFPDTNLWQSHAATILLTSMLAAPVAYIASRKYRRLYEHVRREIASRRSLVEHLGHLMKHANDIILLTDADWRIVDANHRALESYGYSLPELLQMHLPDLRTPKARKEFVQQMANLKDGDGSLGETVHQRKNGNTFPVEVSDRVISIGGIRCGLVIVRDITQHKARVQEMKRLTRLYATISQINQTIARVRSREQLFLDVCRITAEQGDFSLAWIGWLNPQTRDIVPLARAGTGQSCLDEIRVSANDRSLGSNFVDTCIREGKPCILNNFSSE